MTPWFSARFLIYFLGTVTHILAQKKTVQSEPKDEEVFEELINIYTYVRKVKEIIH